MLRARILKRSGDPQGAANAMEEARELDGQDRGLNCKSVKYLIRAGRIEEAESVAGLFTKVSILWNSLRTRARDKLLINANLSYRKMHLHH